MAASNWFICGYFDEGLFLSANARRPRALAVELILFFKARAYARQMEVSQNILSAPLIFLCQSQFATLLSLLT